MMGGWVGLASCADGGKDGPGRTSQPTQTPSPKPNQNTHTPLHTPTHPYTPAHTHTHTYLYTRINRYEIISTQRLGGGHFGTIFAVREVKTGRECVIKLYKR
jgi:hypothetical protein